MAILLVATDRKLGKVKNGLLQLSPELEVYVWPQVPDYSAITFAALWKQPAGLLAKLTGLKAISSIGAGVDGIISDPDLNPNLPVARIVDPQISHHMAEYVLATILSHHCRLPEYHNYQQQKKWQPMRRLQGKNVAVLGTGQIGSHVGERLSQNGFSVSGWNRSGKACDDMMIYSGNEGLLTLAQWADYIVCLLPDTAKTKGLLDETFFSHTKPSAVLINVGRGSLVNERVLINAVSREQLSAAYLDVFEQEPLPAENPMWATRNIFITPHISAITDTQTVVAQLHENYQRLNRGELLKNLVNQEYGY